MVIQNELIKITVGLRSAHFTPGTKRMTSLLQVGPVPESVSGNRDALALNHPQAEPTLVNSSWSCLGDGSKSVVILGIGLSLSLAIAKGNKSLGNMQVTKAGLLGRWGKFQRREGRPPRIKVRTWLSVQRVRVSWLWCRCTFWTINYSSF